MTGPNAGGVTPPPKLSTENTSSASSGQWPAKETRIRRPQLEPLTRRLGPVGRATTPTSFPPFSAGFQLKRQVRHVRPPGAGARRRLPNPNEPSRRSARSKSKPDRTRGRTHGHCAPTHPPARALPANGRTARHARTSEVGRPGGDHTSMSPPRIAIRELNKCTHRVVLVGEDTVL